MMENVSQRVYNFKILKKLGLGFVLTPMTETCQGERAGGRGGG